MTNIVHLDWEEDGVPYTHSFQNFCLEDLEEDLRACIRENTLLLKVAIRDFEKVFGRDVNPNRVVDGMVPVEYLKTLGADNYERQFTIHLERFIRLFTEELSDDGSSEGMGFHLYIYPYRYGMVFNAQNLYKMYKLHSDGGEYAQSHLNQLIRLAEEIIENEDMKVRCGKTHEFRISYSEMMKMMLDCTRADASTLSLEVRISLITKAIACAVVHRGEPYPFEAREIFGVVE